MRKPTRYHLAIGTALAALLLCGCGHTGDRAAFAEANALSGTGKYQASLDRYGQIAAQYPEAADRAQFEMGIIHAHPGNGGKDIGKARDCFRTVIRDYPGSAYRKDSEMMLFSLDTLALKDGTIAAQQALIAEQQATIGALRGEVSARENDLLALRQQIDELGRKHFAYVLKNGSADRILIEKKERRLTLFSQGEVLKTYRISLGGNPDGPKERLGDNKTPEGLYTIDGRNKDSRYHLSLHVSYPNEKDKKRARELGVAPGGDIMIHGLKNGFSWVGDLHTGIDWTKGCIAVTDEEIEEIARLAPNGTTVEIRP